jgi:hypothetical protein
MKLRKDRLLPKRPQSNTDKSEPKRALPWTERVDPSLIKLRIERELPKRKKSRTDIDDPKVTLWFTVKS